MGRDWGDKWDWRWGGQVTSVAGVRGAEAEDEALEHLYYRKSMKGLSQLELQKALGKLLKKKSTVTDTLILSKINRYIKQLEKKIVFWKFNIYLYIIDIKRLN